MTDHPQVYYHDDGLQVYHELPEDTTTAVPEIKKPAPAHHGSSEKSNALLGLKQSASIHYDQGRKKRRIMGLQRQTFLLVITLILVVIVSAVGGGVGGSLAVQRAKSKSESRITPETPYIPVDPAAVPFIDNSCPPNNQVLTAYNGTTFHCLEQKSIKGFDIIGLVAYTLQACIDACITYNSMANAELKCHAVVLATDMGNSYTASGANCWLKRNTVSESDLVKEVNETAARLCPSLSGCLN